MKALIVDDERLARKELTNLLQDYPEIEIVGEAVNAEDAEEKIKSLQPDLLFLDIQMPGKTGFELLQSLESVPEVIFTTAYDHYAIRAFEVNSIAYLLKPIQKEKLQQSLEKYHSLKDKFTPHDPLKLDRLVDIIQKGSSNYKARFLVKVGQKIKSIPTAKIAYFYTREKLNYIVTKSGDKYPVDHTLEEVDTGMDPKIFFRANRKFVINIEAVKEIHPYFKGRLKIELDPEPDLSEDLVISSERTPAFKEWLDQ